jgi:hypothetical protein
VFVRGRAERGTDSGEFGEGGVCVCARGRGDALKD